MLFQELLWLVVFYLPSICEGAIPGTFFWRPRLGIDLAVPTTEPPIASFQPNKKNIQAGIVVLIDGYDVMTSLLALLQGINFALDDETMNPATGLYFVGVYRWALRTLHLIPHWLRGNFHDALAVWYSRFKYMDTEVPDFMKKALPWVPEETWDKEKTDLTLYRKFAESSFTQFYRFPNKIFNNFQSFLATSVHSFVFSSVERVNEVILTDQERKERKEQFKEVLKKGLQKRVNRR